MRLILIIQKHTFDESLTLLFHLLILCSITISVKTPTATISQAKNQEKYRYQVKSVYFKKTVMQILFLSKLWYILFWSVLSIINTDQNKKYHNFERNKIRATVFLQWTVFHIRKSFYLQNRKIGTEPRHLCCQYGLEGLFKFYRKQKSWDDSFVMIKPLSNLSSVLRKRE